MSRCWFKPASAVPPIWGYSPHRAPVAGRKACRERSRRVAHVCAPKEFPASSLQLRFPESDGPAVPPSRHAGRCCGIPGSRANHRELRRSPEIGLPTSRPALSAVEGTARSRKSFIMHCYEKRACKSFGIHSHKIIGLKVPWNEYLQKKGGWGGRRDQKRAFLAAPKWRPSTPCLLRRPEEEAFWYIPPHSHFSIREGLRYGSRTP